MMIDSWQTNLFLGCGGKGPRIEMYDVSAEQKTVLAELPEGQSVYAIATNSSEQDLAVFGTKAGLLYQLSKANNGEFRHPYKLQRFVQGAPVLSVCNVTPSQLVASDVAGRCLLWELQNGTTPTRLPTGRGVVCSLLKLDDANLVGLSSEGELLFWRVIQGELVRTIAVPPPPALSALVNLVYWPTGRALAWPGRGGLLVLYTPEDGKIRCVDAHVGDFYAVFEVEGDLMTVGMNDGRLKRWQAGGDESFADYPVVAGVISGAVLRSEEAQLLLVNDHGQASIYTFDMGKLHFNGRVPGRDYRVVAGPCWHQVEAFSAHQRAVEAQQLADRIKEAIDHNRLGGIEELHSQLVGMGYPHVSLALKAEQAQRQEDVVTELRMYHELVQLLPEDEPAARGSLERYATLLESVLQFEEAQAIYNRISECSHDAAQHGDRLSEYIEALRNRDTIIESDVPVPVILQSAAVTGKPFVGRFVLVTLKPKTSRGVILTTESILEKYEQVRQESGGTLPSATHQLVHWLSKNRIEQAEVITIEDGVPSEIKGFQFGLKTVNASLQTVIVPMILFNPAAISSDGDIAGHIQSVLAALERANDKALTNGWLGRVVGAVDQAIGRLINQARATIFR